MTDFFELYDVLIRGVVSDAPVKEVLCGQCWTAVETADHFGMAMTTPVDTAPRLLGQGYTGMSLTELAAAAKTPVDDIMDQSGLPLMGVVPEDSAVTLAAVYKKPLVLYGRKSATAAACCRIARRLQGYHTPVFLYI